MDVKKKSAGSQAKNCELCKMFNKYSFYCKTKNDVVSNLSKTAMSCKHYREG
jgi:hypothetical protein